VKAVRFLVLAAAAFLAAGPLTGLIGGLLGLPPGPGGMWLHAAVVALLLLATTGLALRLDGESFAALGLAPSPRRAAEAAVGFLAGALLFALIALVQAAAVGAPWEFRGAAGFRAALVGLPLALVLLLGEELVFRGYAFRRLAAAWGAGAALAVSASAFGLYHLVGSGHWAMGAVFRFAMPVLGGLVLGAAMIRTRGLALPLGLHLGGNWVQAGVMGLGAPGGVPPGALFTAALTPHQVHALTAPDLLPHLPYLLALAAMSFLVAAWPAPAPAPARGRP
jgi:uncharacterized protein